MSRATKVKGYKVTEHFDNGSEVVWQAHTDAMGVVATFSDLEAINRDGQSDRFNADLPFVTSITIEVIR